MRVIKERVKAPVLSVYTSFMAYIKEKNKFIAGSQQEIRNKKKSFWKELSVFFVFSGFILASSPLGALAGEFTSEKVIQLVNESRLSHKENVLVRNDLLTKVAQMKIDDMFSRGYFAHTSPEGKTPWVWFKSAGYDYEFAGENLAIHFTDAESQHQAWMRSATHRKNILNPEYREIGVAIRQGVLEGHKTIVTVQEFGSRTGVAAHTPVQKKETQKVLAAEKASPALKEAVPIVYPEREVSWNVSYNQLYAQVFLFFWSIMGIQVLILGYMFFRSVQYTYSRKTRGGLKVPVQSA